MKGCLKYLQENHPKGSRINYNLRQVCTAINKLAPGNPVKFYEKISKVEMKKALKGGTYDSVYREESDSYIGDSVEWPEI